MTDGIDWIDSQVPSGEKTSGGGTQVELKSNIHGIVGIALGARDGGLEGSCDGEGKSDGLDDSVGDTEQGQPQAHATSSQSIVKSKSFVSAN
jgi:hypothetical protein